jgi:probable HAF family extracellular repeat protein
MRMLPAALLSALLFYPADSFGEWVIDVLGPMNGRPTYATAINNRGVVVGYGFDATGYQVPFVWTESAGYQTIVGDALGRATDINNRGEVVGDYTPDGLGTPPRGFLWSEAAGLVDLGPGVLPRAINDAGVIAGSCGVSGRRPRAQQPRRCRRLRRRSIRSE